MIGFFTLDAFAWSLRLVVPHVATGPNVMTQDMGTVQCWYFQLDGTRYLVPAGTPTTGTVAAAKQVLTVKGNLALFSFCYLVPGSKNRLSQQLAPTGYVCTRTSFAIMLSAVVEFTIMPFL